MVRTSPPLQRGQSENPDADHEDSFEQLSGFPHEPEHLSKEQATSGDPILSKGKSPERGVEKSAGKLRECSKKLGVDVTAEGVLEPELTRRSHDKSTRPQSLARTPRSNPYPQHRTQRKNDLSQLIPGYTAPLRLGADLSTRKSTVSVSLTELQRQAMHEETKKLVGPTGSLSGDVKSFKTGRISKRAKAAASATMGDGWFGMRPSPMTNEVKNDLALIRNRNYLDPKRFYKSADVQSGKHKNTVQVGTVIEGAFSSSRLTKKQRRSNLTDEVLADAALSSYAQTKFRNIQREKTAASKKSKRKKVG